MDKYEHTILFVDDEKSVLNSLKRLLRKEEYRILTALSAKDALNVMEKEEAVSIVVSDHRMPEMSGIDFLARVKIDYPDVIRIILTGYTEVNAITESVNQGHIYKFFLKPWDDNQLKLELRQALEQYRLIKANKNLHEKVFEKNKELEEINENLELLVKERTVDLEVQNQALELSRVILDDLPIPVIGVSVEGMIVFMNSKVSLLTSGNDMIELGKNILDYFPIDVKEQILESISSGNPCFVEAYRSNEDSYDIDMVPLSGSFTGKGVVLSFYKSADYHG